MKIDIALLRHALERDEAGFFGMTDVPLSKAGIELITRQKDKYPQAALVFSSSLARCVETANIIYPSVPVVILKKLDAPCYGDFEGKTFADLKHDERFEKWVNAPDLQACPNGEEPFSIVARSAAAFKQICGETAGKGLRQIAVVTHKFIIQAILQRYYVPRGYADWNVPTGGGYLLRYNTLTSTMKILDEI